MPFYNPERIDVSIDCGDELVTKQEFKDECDINQIISNYKQTGIIEHITQQQASYEDLPDLMDYQESLHAIERAQEAFALLPSVVRRYFDNDAAKLLEAIGNPDMRDTLTELGIFQRPYEPTPPGNPANVTIPTSGPPTLPRGAPITPPQPPPAAET